MTKLLKSYCPLHESEVQDCDQWCLPRRIEMAKIDLGLRHYFFYAGYRFGPERMGKVICR